MAARLRFLFRAAVLAVLGWQTALFVQREYAHVAATAHLGADLRFAADTAARVRRVLGTDADVYDALRRLVPNGTMLVNRQVQGPAIDLEHVRALEARRAAGDETALRELLALQTAFERLSARNGLFVQLTALLFPDPFFVSVPDPIALIESEVAAGRQPWLFVLDGDPEPGARAGWRRVHDSPRFRLWRFQKA